MGESVDDHCRLYMFTSSSDKKRLETTLQARDRHCRYSGAMFAMVRASRSSIALGRNRRRLGINQISLKVARPELQLNKKLHRSFQYADIPFLSCSGTSRACTGVEQFREPPVGSARRGCGQVAILEVLGRS